MREPLARRAAIVRGWPLAADVLATTVVLMWCIGTLGEPALRPLAVLVVPLVLILGRAKDRDVGDQGPRLVHVATLYALLAFLLHDWFAAGQLGPHHVLLLWAAIFALAPLLPALAVRRLARREFRHTSPANVQRSEGVWRKA